MPRELEENLNKLSYKNACSGIYNILDFSKFHIQDNPHQACNGSEVPANIHFKEFEVHFLKKSNCCRQYFFLCWFCFILFVIFWSLLDILTRRFKIETIFWIFV